MVIEEIPLFDVTSGIESYMWNAIFIIDDLVAQIESLVQMIYEACFATCGIWGVHPILEHSKDKFD